MMKFIVDAQLPPSLAKLLQEKGYDAIHTMDLPNQNDTPDEEINQLSLAQERIVITKDSDFTIHLTYTRSHTSYYLFVLGIYVSKI